MPQCECESAPALASVAFYQTLRWCSSQRPDSHGRFKPSFLKVSRGILSDLQPGQAPFAYTRNAARVDYELIRQCTMLEDHADAAQLQSAPHSVVMLQQ